MKEQINADELRAEQMNILEREVEYFLSTLKDSKEFIYRKVAKSKEFLHFKKERDKQIPSLFAYDEQGVGQGLFAS